MIAVIVLASVAILFLLIYLTWQRTKTRLISPTTTQTVIALHAIRRRLELVQFKAAIRRDGQRTQRELHDELSTLRRQKKLNF